MNSNKEHLRSVTLTFLNIRSKPKLRKRGTGSIEFALTYHQSQQCLMTSMSMDSNDMTGDRSRS